MNTSIISKTKTKNLPYFPVLKVGKYRRVFSKHFTNTSLWLSPSESCLLNWYCYQAKADNTFKYSTHGLEQIRLSYIRANAEYNGIKETNPYRLPQLRQALLNLIEIGLILPTNQRHIFMINPILTYNVDIITVKQYNELQEYYQTLSADNTIKLVEYFSNLVSQFLESKKKNYTYGKSNKI